MTDSELMEHLHARGWRTEAIDVPMIREACKALQLSASAEPMLGPNGSADRYFYEAGFRAGQRAASPVTAAREQEASATGAEPVGVLTVSRFRGHLENTAFDYTGSLPDGSYPLFTATPTTSTTGKGSA
jgi:hypothetical protein